MSAPVKTAIYAFSADPITFGHINIVERVARCFDKLVVGIGRNPLKKYTFSLEQRLTLAKKALAHLPNVEVLSFDGMMVDFAYEQGAKIIVKGVRNAADMDYEQTLHLVGVSQEMGIDTYLLFADPQLAHVSSSVVKAMQLEQGFIHHYVPLVVKAALEAKISQQLILGVTGSIASGKTSLCKKLQEQAAQLSIPLHHINLDIIAHELLLGQHLQENAHLELQAQLVDLLGEAILEDDEMNRHKIADLIFHNQDLLKAFNQLMEKPMSMLLRRQLKNKQGIILIDSALLLDVELLNLVNNRCILCSVEESVQKHRMSQRGYSETMMDARLQSQYSNSEKAKGIEAAIEKAGFGQRWVVDTNQELAGDFLQNIIDACEEWKWIETI
jgi:pantetheine-phosphate adenylyltransferase